jgi:acyl carrier protein
LYTIFNRTANIVHFRDVAGYPLKYKILRLTCEISAIKINVMELSCIHCIIFNYHVLFGGILMQTFEKITEIIQRLSGIPKDRIFLESTTEELRLGPLDLAEVVLAVEEEFDIIIFDEDSIKGIRDLVNCVTDQIEAA